MIINCCRWSSSLWTWYWWTARIMAIVRTMECSRTIWSIFRKKLKTGWTISKEAAKISRSCWIMWRKEKNSWSSSRGKLISWNTSMSLIFSSWNKHSKSKIILSMNVHLVYYLRNLGVIAKRRRDQKTGRFDRKL